MRVPMVHRCWIAGSVQLCGWELVFVPQVVNPGSIALIFVWEGANSNFGGRLGLTTL